MESSTSKTEVFKPMLFKVGIPLAVSVASFIYARIMAQRIVPKESLHGNDLVSSLEINSQERRDEDSFHSLSSIDENGSHSLNSACRLPIGSLEIDDYKPEWEEEILRLRGRLEDIQIRESELEMQFISYCDLKEKESALLELSNMLLLEMARVEFMNKEVSSMEAESQRLEKMVGEYLKVLEQLEECKSGNEMLQRQVRMHLTEEEVQSRIIREQNLKLDAKEIELLGLKDQLEVRTKNTKKLEDEVGELRIMLNQLQYENNGILEKLQLKEKLSSSISKIEREEMRIEDYKRLAEELKQLQKDQADEHKEVIYLRWINACLRHELMRNKAQQEHNNEEKSNHFQIESDISTEIGNNHGPLRYELASEHNADNDEPSFGIVRSDHQACPKRPKLFRRLKRWVEGSSDLKGRGRVDEKERHEDVINCFGRHSVSHDAEEHQYTRRSCSSA